MDGLERVQVWAGRHCRLAESDSSTLYEVVDWGAGKDNIVRSLRLKPVEGKGRTRWVRASAVTLLGGDR